VPELDQAMVAQHSEAAEVFLQWVMAMDAHAWALLKEHALRERGELPSCVRTSELAAVPFVHPACLQTCPGTTHHSWQARLVPITCSTGRHGQGQVRHHVVWARRQMTCAHPPVDIRIPFVEHWRSEHLAQLLQLNLTNHALLLLSKATRCPSTVCMHVIAVLECTKRNCTIVTEPNTHGLCSLNE
jgi:hypothetical protein